MYFRYFLIPVLFMTVIIPWTGKGEASADRVKLERGEILLHYEKSPKGGIREVVGEIIFNAPVDLVWEVITDYHHYVDFVPGLEESRLVRREGPQAWQYLKYPNIWPFPDFECTLLILEEREEGKISFQMLSGDLESFYGSWKIEKYRGGADETMATYRLHKDFGNLAPDFTKEWSNRSTVYDELRAFRERIGFEKLKNAGEPEEVMKPSWRKALFWWERDGESQDRKNPED